MKKRLSKLISAAVILAMVVSSTGVVLADTNEVYHKEIPNVNKPIGSISGEKQEPKKKTEIHKTSEKFRDLQLSGNSIDKMKAARAGASEIIAESGSNEYTSLQAAIDNAANGDTITVLADIVGESVVIDRGKDFSLTIDFDGHGIISDQEDIIAVYSGNVNITDGLIANLKEDAASDDAPTGVCVFDANVKLQTCAVCTSDDGTAGYFAGDNASLTLNKCAYADSAVAEIGDKTVPKDVAGVVIDNTSTLVMNDVEIEAENGDGLVSFGKATVNNSYVVSQNNGYCSVIVAEIGDVFINEGYYYGSPALYVADSTASATVKKGEFVSSVENCPAIACFDDNSFGKNVTIPSGYTSYPSNWKTYSAENVYIYKKYSAPKTVTAKLCKYNGIALSWSKVTGAKAYKVYYKKSTSSNYTLLKTTTATSLTKTGLTSGAKYYFKVYGCDKLDKTTVPYYGKGYYRSANSIYTLKKLNTPSVYKYSSNYVKVKWNNISGETGYQISRSTSKTGTNVVYTYKTTSGTYKTIKATKGRTYYYKVRAYKTVDDKKIYGPWSYVKSYKLI